MTDHQRGMDMSNAMIEAACSATILGEDEQGRPVHLSPEEARTALTAAISAYLATTEPGKPESGVLADAVKVKPLEWKGVAPIAESVVGTYSTSRINGNWKVMLSVSAHLHEATIARGEAADFDVALIEAKAAAQADFEQRIMSALSTPPQPVDLGVDIEEVKRVLKPFADEAAAYDPDTGDGDDICWVTPAYFKIRDLRKVRSILSKIEGGEDGN